MPTIAIFFCVVLMFIFLGAIVASAVLDFEVPVGFFIGFVGSFVLMLVCILTNTADTDVACCECTCVIEESFEYCPTCGKPTKQIVTKCPAKDCDFQCEPDAGYSYCPKCSTPLK